MKVNHHTYTHSDLDLGNYLISVTIFRNMGEELADEGDHVGAIAAIAQTKLISQVRFY